MDTTTAPSANGRHRPAKATKTTPVKVGTTPPAPAKPKARPKLPYAERSEVFADYSPERFRRYQHFLDRLPGCPGYQAIAKIITDARPLRNLVAETIADHGPGSGRVIEKYDQEFDEFGTPPGLWDELMSMVCTLTASTAAVDSNLPMVGRHK